MQQIIILGLVLIVAFVLMAFFLNKKISSLAIPQDAGVQKLMLDLLESLRKEVGEAGEKNRKEVQERLDKISETFQKSLSSSSFTLQRQFKDSARIIAEVTQKLTKLDETNTQVLNFSKQLQSLENILKNPKQRGILGEYYLETMLSNVLPPNHYQMQYKFKNGEVVDAVIFNKDKLIPIDAKFSLEKYNKIMEEKDELRRQELEKEFKLDIKNRIDETSKYIRPQEGTMDFAIMYIPAEGIYYNLLIYKVGSISVSAHNLLEYAFKRRVIIVSPISFFAYLQTVLQGLRGLQVEESIKDIVKNIEELNKHLITHDEYLQKLGSNLGTTVNMYNAAYKEFKKVDKDVYKITDKQVGGSIDPLMLEKPNVE